MARANVDKILGAVLTSYGRAAQSAKAGACAASVYDFKEALRLRCVHARLLHPDSLGYAAQTIEESEANYLRQMNDGPCGARG